MSWRPGFSGAHRASPSAVAAGLVLGRASSGSEGGHSLHSPSPIGMVSLSALGLSGLGQERQEWCESIFPTFLSASFPMFALHPDMVIPHLESLALTKGFLFTAVQIDVSGLKGNEPYKFLCCDFADVTRQLNFLFHIHDNESVNSKE